MDEDDDQFWNLSSMIDAMGDPLLPLSMDELLQPPLPVDDFLQPPFSSPPSSAPAEPSQPQLNIGELQMDGGDGKDEQDGGVEEMDSECQQEVEPAEQQDTDVEDQQVDTTRTETEDDTDHHQDSAAGDNTGSEVFASDSDTVVDEDDDYKDDEDGDDEVEPPEKKFKPIGQDFSDYGVSSTLETVASSSQGSGSTSHDASIPSNEFYNLSVSFNNNGHYDNIISDFGIDIDDEETVMMSKIEEKSDEDDDSTDDELGNNEGAADSVFENEVEDLQKEPFIKQEISADFTQDVSDAARITEIKKEGSIHHRDDLVSERFDDKDFTQDSTFVLDERKTIIQDVVGTHIQENYSQDITPVDKRMEAERKAENTEELDKVKGDDTGEEVVGEQKEWDKDKVGDDNGRGEEKGKENEELWGYDSEDIDEMLEQDLPTDVRVPKRKRTDEESGPREKRKDDDKVNEDKWRDKEVKEDEVRTKTVLKGIPWQNRITESLLPPGWHIRYHECGMPFYIHPATRVATWSRPYLLGKCIYKKHKVPEFAIPCLHWRKTEARKKTLLRSETTDQENIKPTQCNKQQQNQPSVKEQTGDEDHSGAKQPNAKCNKDSENSQKSNDKENSQTNEGENSTTQVPHAKHGEGKNDTALTILKDVDESIGLEEFKEYLTRVFEFKEIEIKKYGQWKENRQCDGRKRMEKIKKSQQESTQEKTDRPQLPAGPMLLSCKLPPNDPSGKKELVINAMNKSALVILHEYAQRVMKQSPCFTYYDAHNANAPFEVVVEIGGHKYGKGQARSKKAAKLEAAKNTLDILVPDIAKALKKPGEKEKPTNLEYFDHVRIDDPRVYQLCERSGLLTPWELLNEYQQRNHGMNNMELSFNVTTSKGSRSEYTIKYGPHEATGFCRNKRVGKQEAAQKILVKLHPYLSTWGALIKLYGRRGISSQLEEKKELRKSVIALQKKGKNHRNDHVLNKLKAEMRKLYLKQDKQTGEATTQSAKETADAPQDCTVPMATDTPAPDGTTAETSGLSQDGAIAMDTQQDGAEITDSLHDGAPDTSLAAS